MFDLDAFRFTWRDAVDIGLVGFLFYRLMLLIQGTRATSVVYGLLLVLVGYYLSDVFELITLNWLLANFLGSIALIIVILFQRDIKTALAEVGAGSLWRRRKITPDLLDPLVEAVLRMAADRVGALIVLERSVPLGDLADKGVELNARLTSELLLSIFYPGTPLHDGAVIVRGGKLAAAGCILPLTPGMKAHAKYGTRHRAALGVSEESDALALVVSEERGEISLAMNGRLTAPLDESRLRRVLTNAWSGST